MMKLIARFDNIEKCWKIEVPAELIGSDPSEEPTCVPVYKDIK